MIKVSPICHTHLKDVVDIHNSAFKDFFLTQLGDNFLKLYYSSLLKNKKGILLGCFDNDKLCGFCAATTLSKGFNIRLIKDNLKAYSFVGARLFLTKPRALIRLVKNFTKSDSTVEDSGNYAELLSIGVNSRMQGGGVGKKLLLELERIMIEKEIKQLSLTTDYYNNDKGIGFYKSLGYEIMYEFTAYPDRKMYRLIKNI